MIMRAFAVGLAALCVLPSSLAAPTWVQQDKATLRALDKITGRSSDIDIKAGEPIIFGALEVELMVCYQTPPEEAPESAAFLQVRSVQPMETEAGLEEKPQVFSGWMFASSPGLSALEHPVYDVWVIECQTPDVPVSPAEAE